MTIATYTDGGAEKVLLFNATTTAVNPAITAQIVSIIRDLYQVSITQVILTQKAEGGTPNLKANSVSEKY